MNNILNSKYLLHSKKNIFKLTNSKYLQSPAENILLHQRNVGNLPTTSQVVICGSGIVGNSIAYHFTQEGWRDVLVIDQNKIGSGTSSYGSGVVGLFRDFSERWVVTHSLKLLQKLQREGHDVGLRKCGSLNLAQTRDRAISLKRRMAYIKPSGLKCVWLDRNEAQTLHPHLATGDLEGAVWLEEDSVADVQKVCRILAQLAREGGATYVEGCRVLSVESDVDLRSQVTPRVSLVNTTLGPVKCEYFVNAAGMWARELGVNSRPSVRVPAFPAEHSYLHTVPMAEASDSLPIVRDYDSHCFCLTRDSKFVLGGFEEEAKPVFEDGVPRDWRAGLKVDEQHFQPLKEGVLRRIPLLRSASFEPLLSGADNFTQDGKWILGETPEIDNYFVAVGMNGNSLQSGVGAGVAVVEWVVQGTPSTQMTQFDVRRFLDLHNNRRYLKERTREVVGRHYAIEYPGGQSEFKLARKLRCSPIYVELEERGAVFGTRMGFERPLYFDLSHKAGDPPAQMPPGSFSKPPYLDSIRAEYFACREGVGVMDLSSFTKIEIKSAGFDRDKEFEAREAKSSVNQVVEYMEKLCSNDVMVPVGGIVHTGMHNDRGGYENDCLLIRTAENSYLMLAPTLQQTRIMDWMQRQITAAACVSVSDVTSMYSVLCVVGPKSRDMLSVLTNTDLAFHGHKARVINIAYASGVLILAFTHVGEPGYTLIIPSEYTLHIYNRLMEVGDDYGVKNVGLMTLRSLRVEKFIPFWAEEIDSITNPYEVGRGYRVKLDKGYFIGKFALKQESEHGPRRRLVHFVLGDEFEAETELWPWGREAVYRDGEHVGEVTSTAYGFTLGNVICLGWVQRPDGGVVTPEYIMKGNPRFEIDICGKRFPMRASLQPPKMQVAKMDGVASSYRPKVRGILTTPTQG